MKAIVGALLMSCFITSNFVVYIPKYIDIQNEVDSIPNIVVIDAMNWVNWIKVIASFMLILKNK